MLRLLTQTMLLTLVAAVPLTAQTQRMWYRGSFDGWVDHRSAPAHGYYYHPSPDPAYPLNESSYGQPIPCASCGHAHFPGEEICPRCGLRCPRGGNNESPNTVYTQRRLPGQYYYQEQPHYRFVSPQRLGGTYQKYTRPYN